MTTGDAPRPEFWSSDDGRLVLLLLPEWQGGWTLASTLIGRRTATYRYRMREAAERLVRAKLARYEREHAAEKEAANVR